MHILRIVLRLNAASCLVFGTLFLLHPEATARLLGTPSALAVSLVGVVLLFNGGHLVWASLRRQPRPAEIYYFSMGDLLWVSLTMALIGTETFITTSEGIIVSSLVAVLVGALGILQAAILGQFNGTQAGDDHLPGHISTARAIATSWLSMKPWVKYWLFGLNAIFLASAAFWPDPLARISLTAYLASAPWLLAIMISQRGLTRFLGVAHLIPWIPLMMYLLLRFTTEIVGPQISYHDAPFQFTFALTLLTMLGICLLLDIIDVWRWIRGERYRLGSAAAARRGASALSRIALVN